jgi:hypothetical protein
LHDAREQALAASAELGEIDAALLQARERLEQARHAVERDRECDRIRELLKLNNELRKYGKFMDEAANDLASALRGLISNTLNKGLVQPASLDRVLTLRRCLAVIFADLPAGFREPIDYPGASDRASFGSFSQVIEAWSNANATALEYRLRALDGEQANTEAA